MQYESKTTLPLIVLDVSNLAYRAFHVLQDLSHDGIQTGVSYGILRDMLDISAWFGTPDIAFAFDVGRPLRCDVYEGYKSGRKKRENEDPELAEARQRVREQIQLFREDVLPALGYQNVFSQEGYEADDIIAGICENTQRDVVIVGTDQDLFQLLNSRVCIYNPISKKTITRKSFTEKYGVSPTMWPTVKAMTGCKSDNVIGIMGVGEKTAAKFLMGGLKPGRLFDLITQNSDLWSKNEPIVRLPYPGLNKIELMQDNVSAKKWEAVLKCLGITSLRYHG